MNFNDKLGNYQEVVQEALKEYFAKNRLLGDGIKNFVLSGGKRIRPVALLSSSEHFGPLSKDVIRVSLSIELVHNSSLCHDDIMDEDSKRRDTDTCHKAFQKEFLQKYTEKEYLGDIFSKNSVRYGTALAIISGNILNNEAYRILVETSFPNDIKQRALDWLISTVIRINEGQVLDMGFEQYIPNTEEYLVMVRKKTAELLGCSFALGAVLADSDKNTVRQFYDFGISIGIAFQIIDDIIDIEPTKGNTAGSDIKKGKKSILSLYSLENSPEKDTFRDILQNRQDQLSIEKGIEIYRSCGAVEYAKSLAKKNTDYAMSIAGCLKNDFMAGLADYLLSRSR